MRRRGPGNRRWRPDRQGTVGSYSSFLQTSGRYCDPCLSDVMPLNDVKVASRPDNETGIIITTQVTGSDYWQLLRMILTLEVTGSQAQDMGAGGRKVFKAIGGTIGRLPDNDWV